jgi:hypothetical protein
MCNNLENRRLFALIFCIGAGLISLSAAVLKDGSSSQISFVVLTLFSMSAAIVLVSERIRYFFIKLSSLLRIRVSNYSFPDKIVDTEMVNGNAVLRGSDPTLPGVVLPRDVRITRNELDQITKDGFSPNNCKNAIFFIEGQPPEIRDHWIIELARASYLAFLERFDEAKPIAVNAIENPNCRQEVGIARSLLAYILEATAPLLESADYEKVLKLRKEHIEDGLAHFPERHSLHMTNFEIHVELGNSQKCEVSLRNAIEINPGFTRDKLIQLTIGRPELVKRAQGLSSRLNRLIKSMQNKKDREERVYELVKAAVMASSLFAMLVFAATSAAVSFINYPGSGSNGETRLNWGAASFAPTGNDLKKRSLFKKEGHDLKAASAESLTERAAIEPRTAGSERDSIDVIRLDRAEGHDVKTSRYLAEGHDVKASRAVPAEFKVGRRVASAEALGHDV